MKMIDSERLVGDLLDCGFPPDGYVVQIIEMQPEIKTAKWLGRYMAIIETLHCSVCRLDKDCRIKPNNGIEVYNCPFGIKADFGG